MADNDVGVNGTGVNLKRHYSGVSLVSMIFGIIGMVLSCVGIGILFDIVALILAIIALSRKNEKKGIAITGLVTAVVGVIAGSIFLISILSTDTEVKNGEEKIERLGELGEDCFVKDLDGAIGKEVTVSGNFWDITADGYYIVLYQKEKENGAAAATNFFVKDETENKVLSALDDVSYEEKVVVTVTGILDRAEVVERDNGSTTIYYYLTAYEAEILE